jgi:Nif-specific regulatory protein
VRRLATLLDTSQALTGTIDLKAGLHRVLEVLGRHHGAVRSSVVMLDEDTGQLQVEASDGLDSPGYRVSYQLGEGITGRVVESGRPIVVPQISREPMFLNRAAKRSELPQQELSFICVPIILNRKPVGALGVDLRFKQDRDYDRTQKFLGVVASMISQAVKVQRLIDGERKKLLDENTHLRQELKERYDFSNLLGTSGPMRQICEQVAQVARTMTTVLIRGESGTGKELIAHALHYNSLRANKPFVKVSCAALPESLIESELFGYEKGAFTGAQQRKKGRFELAEGGTLFLDEIGDINPATQVKLLRVLQEREYERLGGTETLKTNVRMVTATNKDLEKAIADGSFREDLYYRLNVISVSIPPLRARMEDIPILVEHFLERFNTENRKNVSRVTPAVMDRFFAHTWPGNVRELENVVERGVVLARGEEIDIDLLPTDMSRRVAFPDAPPLPEGVRFYDAVGRFERQIIEGALRRTGGVQKHAAELLGLKPTTLNEKIKRLGILV